MRIFYSEKFERKVEVSRSLSTWKEICILLAVKANDETDDDKDLSKRRIHMLAAWRSATKSNSAATKSDTKS